MRSSWSWHRSLHNNALTGTIPVELSAMTSITYLNLNYNSLTGTIPAELSAMTSMRQLCELVNHFSCEAWRLGFE